MNPDDKTQTYQHHKEVYGVDMVYDDFIANFSASRFDAKDWVDFFVDSGARYFVPTTKHHDGFSLFDMPSEVSDRNSVYQNPHRDFIRVRLFLLKYTIPKVMSDLIL
jgi:alpha-L-fucosidase